MATLRKAALVALALALAAGVSARPHGDVRTAPGRQLLQEEEAAPAEAESLPKMLDVPAFDEEGNALDDQDLKPAKNAAQAGENKTEEVGGDGERLLDLVEGVSPLKSLRGVFREFRKPNVVNCILKNVPNVYPFTHDYMDYFIGDYSIPDGGQDLFDDGNVLYVKADGDDEAGPLKYWQSGTPEPAGSGDITYVTKLAFSTAEEGLPRSLFFAGFDSPGGQIEWVRMDGDMGADGSGDTDFGSIGRSVINPRYEGFARKIYGAGDPSYNQIMLVPRRSWTVTASANTNEDDLTVTAPAGGAPAPTAPRETLDEDVEEEDTEGARIDDQFADRVYYLMWAGSQSVGDGIEYPVGVFQNVMDRFFLCAAGVTA